jgi:hypothetical protein
MRGLISDIRRLAKVCAYADRHSLQTNYLVLTRSCPSERDTTDRLVERINTALDEIDLGHIGINVVCSEKLEPYLNRDHQPVANRAFQIVVLEVQR